MLCHICWRMYSIQGVRSPVSNLIYVIIIKMFGYTFIECCDVMKNNLINPFLPFSLFFLSLLFLSSFSFSILFLLLFLFFSLFFSSYYYHCNFFPHEKNIFVLNLFIIIDIMKFIIIAICNIYHRIIISNFRLYVLRRSRN